MPIKDEAAMVAELTWGAYEWLSRETPTLFDGTPRIAFEHKIYEDDDSYASNLLICPQNRETLVHMPWAIAEGLLNRMAHFVMGQEEGMGWLADYTALDGFAAVDMFLGETGEAPFIRAEIVWHPDRHGLPVQLPFQVMVQGYCSAGKDMRLDMEASLQHVRQYFCEKVTDREGDSW